MAEAQFISGRSSVKVSKTAKGDYSWEIKIYYDDDKKEKEVINRIENINRTLKQKFGGK